MSHLGLDSVRRGIRDAAAAVGRDPRSITLIAVSKTFEPSDILPVIAAGQVAFGENRVQEAQVKWLALKTQYPRLKLHLIGPLQSNKTAAAVALFDAIHTVDRPKIATALADEMRRQHRTLELFVQVNTGREEQKAGVSPEAADGFLAYCRNDLKLAIGGLMCIPPAAQDTTPHFALLAMIASRNGLSLLSMGMSGDYEIAIRTGATHVRVGSAIFGDRDAPAR